MKQALFKKIQQITEQNLMDIEAHKEKGNHVIGFYCLYGPTELAVAADAIPLPLCGTRQDPIDAAEEVLPRNLCPLIKSSYGFAATDACPFFRFSDMIVADTTCDGKKRCSRSCPISNRSTCCSCRRIRCLPCPLDPGKRKLKP